MSTIAELERVERELRDDASPHLGDGWSLHRKRQADTIAAYIASAKAASQPEAAPAQNSEAVTTGWRSIETAPRDGTAVLLASSAGAWFGTWKPVYQSGYMPLNPWFSLMLNHDHLHRPSGLPTHWMPLPEPPKENATKGSPNPEGLSDG